MYVIHTWGHRESDAAYGPFDTYGEASVAMSRMPTAYKEILELQPLEDYDGLEDEEVEDEPCPNCGNLDTERHDNALSCPKCGWEKMEYFTDED